MKLSVSAFRAQASAQRKILSSYQNQLNYGACTSFPALGGYALEGKVTTMVDSTAITSTSASHPNETNCHSEPSDKELNVKKTEMIKEIVDALPPPPNLEHFTPLDRSPGRTRSKSNQRWMKLRTTVQLSGAINSTNQKSRAPLKREDSFLKRFSTRQIPETQETVDTGDETETLSGSQAQNEVNRRRRSRRKELSKTVVNPDENFYFYWLMTVTICVLYNLWTLIVRQSFPELQKTASEFWYSGDGFTDIVFVCDIIVQFRTGYLEQGLMVYNSKKLASHYLKSRAFILDILSLIPLDFLQFNFGINPLLRFPRFLKVYRVYNYYYMVESRTVYPNLWRVVNLIHILLILAHWFGCFYYLLSEAEGFQGDWVYPHRPGEYATLTRKYLGSLYWSTLTLTTIGDLPTPETNAESLGHSKAMTSSGQSEGIPRRGHKSRLLQFNSNYGYLFTIVSYLIGVFIFATIVGQVGNVITNRNANRLEFERLLDGAKTYMRHHKVPGGMKRRVLRWYDYSWSRGRIQGGGDINTALGLLPDKLKTELALHVNLSVLKKVTIFQECQPEFLHDLVLKMKAYIFTPGDLICRKGEVAREMFIIADGILDVISETGRVLTTMKAGDFFGEIGILNLDGLNKRTADVRSVGYSELFSLSREDVLTAMKDYPEAQDILQSLGRKRLMEAKSASKTKVRQTKDQDSSGESDTAGKRIVEKLRSDVKGLKKALRRSRRGTRTKSTTGGTPETSSKKHSILRRMSHVQSSDEREATVDADQTPIGAGLPLLQRLKILREKQEREAEEKESSKKLYFSSENLIKKSDTNSPEKATLALPFTQKLKLLKQKEVKEASTPCFGSALSTVRTQVTGTQLDRSSTKSKTFTSFKDAGGVMETKTREVKGLTDSKEEVGSGKERIFTKDGLKLLREEQLNDSASPPRIAQESKGTRTLKYDFETDLKAPVNMPSATEAGELVQNIEKNTIKVSASKDGWRLLKKSSISCSKKGEKISENKEIEQKKVYKSGTYFSKSNTVLERQTTDLRGKEKRSRSFSPTIDSQKRKTKKSTSVRRRSKSVGHSPGLGQLTDYSVHFQNFNSSNEEMPKACCNNFDTVVIKSRKNVKKYNSISDLSPEYSGLPFVKKLKILNERQKLEELESELIVRSVSLDVSERPSKNLKNVLMRSQSEARASDYSEDDRPTTEQKRLLNECRIRKLISDYALWECSTTGYLDGSIASPESNETLERRRLKSILKKLSAEGSAGDEDKIWTHHQGCSSPSRKADHSEFKRLIREPTVEGYAARHKKLTKSVTFDSGTLPSPLDAVPEQAQDYTKVRDYTQMSPTAILTLQLSNLSMMPIASPKNTKKSGKQLEENMSKEVPDTQMTEVETVYLQESSDVFKPQSKINYNVKSPFVQAAVEEKIAISSLMKNSQEFFFMELEGEILEIIRQVLEKGHNKVESLFKSLQEEVKKKDKIIAELQSQIQEVEMRYCEILQKKSNSESTDFLNIPFLREDSCETVWDVPVPRTRKTFDLSSAGTSQYSDELEGLPKMDDDVALLSQEPDSFLDEELSEMRSDWESACVSRSNVYLAPSAAETSGFVKRGFRKLIKQTSGDEMELTELRRNESANGSYEQAIPKTTEESAKKRRFMNRMNRFHRSINSRQEFVAVDIDDSSNSSDLETTYNKDWEVEMLVKELEKKDPYWRSEEVSWESHLNRDAKNWENVKKLREEVSTLKKVVCEGDLSRLSGSELNILENLIEAKDQKILEVAKSNSLEHEIWPDKCMSSQKETFNSASESDKKLRESGWLKKSPLKNRMGSALSFDFHDIQNDKRNVSKNTKYRRSCLKAQNSLSGSYQQHQSLYNLWRTSARLKSRVLDNSDRIMQNLTIGGSTSASSRSSLPILVSTSSDGDKTSGFRTSLPILSANNFRQDFGKHFCTSSVTSRPLVGSLEEVYLDSDRQEVEVSLKPETSTTNSLNSFIRSVGHKVKQVMACDGQAVRNQVPTISRLLEEQATLKDSQMAGPGDMRGVDGKAPQRDVSPHVDKPSEALGPLDHDPKTASRDL